MDNCPITDLPASQYQDLGNMVRYEINYDGVEVIIGLVNFDSFSKTEFFINNKYLLAGAILNNQLIEGQAGGSKIFTLCESDWKEKIAKITYPKTPKDKMDNLLKTLYQMQRYDGEDINILGCISSKAFVYKHFFKNTKECRYYLGLLQSKGLIDAGMSSPNSIPRDCQFTLEGLNYYLEISESGRLSNKCFVAMSFSEK